MPQENDKSTLNEWFASLSHDLRNPVHGILSYAGFGIKKIGNGQLTEEKSLHYYQSIRDAGTKLLDMLEDIVLLAKLDVGKILLKTAEWDLETVVKGVLSGYYRYSETTGVSFNLRKAESPVKGVFDSKRVGDVIRRLLDICLAAIDDNTVLTLKCAILNADNEANHIQKPALYFALEHPTVAYSEERLIDMAQLLDEGSSDRKPGQVGLSLAVCHRIIGLHGGRIGVEKQADGGVVFWFLLPVE